MRGKRKAGKGFMDALAAAREQDRRNRAAALAAAVAAERDAAAEQKRRADLFDDLVKALEAVMAWRHREVAYDPETNGPVMEWQAAQIEWSTSVDNLVGAALARAKALRGE